MKNYFKQIAPFVVPTEDGKVIKEHFGLASTQDKNHSLAHMIAPPAWAEPFQTPQFDEITFMIRGRKQIIIDDETVILNAGESILIKKGTRVQYANPFEEAAEYISICFPAFSIDSVHREEEK